MKMIIVAVPILKGFGEGSKVQLDAAPPELKYWAENGSKYIDGRTIATIEEEPETKPEGKTETLSKDLAEIPPIKGEPRLPVKSEPLHIKGEPTHKDKVKPCE